MSKQFNDKVNCASIKLLVGPTQATLSNIDQMIRIESDRQFQKHDKIQYLREKIIELQKIFEQSTKQNDLLKANKQVLTKNLKQANSDVQKLFFKREEGVLKTLKSQRTTIKSGQVQQMMLNEQYSLTDQQSQKEKSNQVQAKLEKNQQFTTNILTTNRYLSLNGDQLGHRTQDSPLQRREQPQYRQRSKSPEFRNILFSFDSEKDNRNKINRVSCDNAANRQKARISNPFKTPNNKFTGYQEISNQSDLHRYESLGYISQNHSMTIMNQARSPQNFQREYPNVRHFNPKFPTFVQHQQSKIKNINYVPDMQNANRRNLNYQESTKASYQPAQPDFPRKQVISKAKQYYGNQKNVSPDYSKGNYLKNEGSGEVSKKTIKKMSINQLWQNSCAQPQSEQPRKRTSRKLQLNYYQKNGLITPQQKIQFDFVRRQTYQRKFDQLDINRGEKQPYLEDQKSNRQVSFSHGRNDLHLQFHNRA